MFNRILGREHCEISGKDMSIAVDGHSAFLHRLEKG